MSVLSVVGDFIDDHKSEIAFGAGVIFTGATTVLAVQATPKALKAIEKAEEEKGAPLTRWEKVKCCWKHYIAPVCTEIAGVTCLLFGKTIDVKATKAAVFVADASQKMLRTYSEKVAEEIGEKEEEKIRKEAVVENSKRYSNTKVLGSEDCSLLDGDAWYFDTMFGKKFVSSDTKIQAALNVVNARINEGDDASYNDFFEEIYNLTPVPANKDLMYGDVCDVFGFRSEDGLVGIDFEQRMEGLEVNGQRVPAYNIIFTYKQSCRTRFPSFIGGYD